MDFQPVQTELFHLIQSTELQAIYSAVTWFWIKMITDPAEAMLAINYTQVYHPHQRHIICGFSMLLYGWERSGSAEGSIC